MNELTRRDEMSLAGAALRGAPWKTAAITGTAASAASFVMAVIGGEESLTWSASLGIGLFALIAAIGAVGKPEVGDRVTRQARLWALRRPWRFALYPALGAATLMYPVQLILDGEGVFGAALDALQGGVVVYLVTALAALVMRGRGQRSLPEGR
ncbi:peptidoglycan/LPS O-acetylase OafA/YrhL [Streptosporangium becharense]|uniref:Peptidoglycan/LPS O-acetylase OafA/YrhL n=1 Tax=Streptosporangium becharense TaxID=1816182 RepID=A0A7W9MHD0_9ACTN|nr:hypothetical protein [Streptosporangium becharense]MBB2912361.1 peptidoglycan/LPS O-acetylase OafA/YrhL [Streptosporangium becharense]MBB5820810.1 peptidoglycan/LPS O-acetylase OafA/YrhL [Streptosporangium becharense]